MTFGETPAAVGTLWSPWEPLEPQRMGTREAGARRHVPDSEPWKKICCRRELSEEALVRAPPDLALATRCPPQPSFFSSRTRDS